MTLNTIGCLDQYTAANNKYTGDECLPPTTNGDECPPQMQVCVPPPKMCYPALVVQYTTPMAPFTNMVYIHYKVWDEITYSILNLNGCTVEVSEWISICIPHFSGHVITYPFWDAPYPPKWRWVSLKCRWVPHPLTSQTLLWRSWSYAKMVFVSTVLFANGQNGQWYLILTPELKWIQLLEN